MALDAKYQLVVYKDTFSNYISRGNSIINDLQQRFNFGRDSDNSSYNSFWSTVIVPTNFKHIDLSEQYTKIENLAQELNDAISTRFMDYVGMVSSLDDYVCHAGDSFSRISDSIWSFGDGQVYNTKFGRLLEDNTLEVVKKGLQGYREDILLAFSEMEDYLLHDPGVPSPSVQMIKGSQILGGELIAPLVINYSTAPVYEWYLDGTKTTTVTPTYIIGYNDLGKRITVKVKYEDMSGVPVTINGSIFYGMNEDQANNSEYLDYKKKYYFEPKFKFISDTIEKVSIELNELYDYLEMLKKGLYIWLPESFKLVAYTSLVFNLSKKNESLANKAIGFGSGVTTTASISVSQANFWKTKILPDQTNRGQCLVKAILGGLTTLTYPSQLASLIDISWDLMIPKYG